ncbi:hypothetical protein AVEN_39064-1 [Araneus ventricosus]|uniref:Peptidase A2 domain-containing protein n=1 Tax=Araneus ventricosus TaxID=182803 RepID=A0A4Y2P9M3_ARAVE|nr:hypothetical protein AVEN_39064-1 [Araneus ventricosus]
MGRSICGIQCYKWCGIQCLILMDIGANVTLLRIFSKTDTGEETEIRGKHDASIESGSTKSYHRIYVADITDPCILGLYFFEKFIFTVDLEKNHIRTTAEEIPLFSVNILHSKSCSVLAKKRTIIPARSEFLIEGVQEVFGQFRHCNGLS